MLNTALSKYFWDLQNTNGVDTILKSEIVERVRNYKVGGKFCLLCIEAGYCKIS